MLHVEIRTFLRQFKEAADALRRTQHDRRRPLDHGHLLDGVERQRQAESVVTTLTAEAIDKDLTQLAANARQTLRAEGV
jgi:hypothetical protein